MCVDILIVYIHIQIHIPLSAENRPDIYIKQEYFSICTTLASTFDKMLSPMGWEQKRRAI